MPRKTFSEEQMIAALRQAEAGTPGGEVCRKLGVTEQTFYRWKRNDLPDRLTSRGSGGA